MALSVLDVTPTSLSSSSSTLNINIPAVTAGNLLIMHLPTVQSRTISTPPSGWTELYTQTNGTARGTAYAIVASATAGATTVAVVMSGNTDTGAQVYRIDGFGSNSIATDIDVGTPATASATSVNAPNVTAGWTGEENLFLIFGSLQGSNPPGTGETVANYTDYERTLSGAGSGTRAWGISWRRLASIDSDNPAASSNLGASFTSITNTIVIKPGIEEHSGSGTLAATSGITGDGDKQGVGDGTLTATAGLSGAGGSEREGSGVLPATAILTASGYKPEIHSGSGTLSASSGLSAAGAKAGQGGATLAAVATFSGSGEAILVRPGYVKLRTKAPPTILSASVPEVTLSTSVPVMSLSEAAPTMELSVRAPSMELRAVLRSS